MQNPSNADIYLLLGEMNAKLDRVVHDAESQDKRIIKLESAKTYERGFAAAIGAVFSLVVTFLFKGHS